MKIIQYEDNKLEIKIKEKDVTKISSENSIFMNGYWNFIYFINSIYDKYCESKNDDEINIEGLLYYYVLIKNEPYIDSSLIFCSIFMEVLKDKIKYGDPDIKHFNQKLNIVFEKLNLDTTKILENLQNEIYMILNNIEDKFLSEDYNKENVKYASDLFKKNYVTTLITCYRNNLIHSGIFSFKPSDIGLAGALKNNTKTEIENKLSEEQYQDKFKSLMDLMYDEIKKRFSTAKCLNDIDNQHKFFEIIVDIILLSYFKVNCTLKPSFEGDYSEYYCYNSRKYITMYTP